MQKEITTSGENPREIAWRKKNSRDDDESRARQMFLTCKFGGPRGDDPLNGVYTRGNVRARPMRRLFSPSLVLTARSID